MNKPHAERLLKFYSDHLHEVIVPFWMDRGIDRQDGGYFTCFDNTGERLVGTDKYVWSQGRFVYVLSALAELTGRGEPYLSDAKWGVDFLREHCLTPNAHCAFLLAKQGEPKEPTPGSGLEVSTYADCFVAGGFAKYAEQTGDQEILDAAVRIYDSILQRIEAGTFKTEPYPLPPGYKSHGVSMIALNTAQDLSAAMRRLQDDRLSEISNRCAAFAAEIMGKFVADGLVREAVGPDGEPPDNIIGRYVNPGHMAESMWFIMHHGRATGDEKLIAKAARLVKSAFRVGWDDQYGGLFQYVDKDGGKPAGSTAGIESCPMIPKLASDWDTKLWWVHSEALYASLLGHVLTGDDELLRMHNKLHEYTFATFPNPNKDVGEWIQIRGRTGEPVAKTVALPVKDPMHIWRNLILLIHLLREIAR